MMTAFWPGMSGPTEVPRWGLLALSPLLLIRTKPMHFGIGHALGLGAIAYAGLTLAWTANIYDGVKGLLHFVFLASVFLIGNRAQSLRLAFVMMGWGVAISGVVAVWQQHDHNIVTHATLDSGLFYNSDILGNAAILVLAGLILYRSSWPYYSWWSVPFVALASYMAWSRGAFVAFAAMALMWLWPRSRKLAFGFIAVGLVLFAYPLLIKAGFAIRWQMLLDNFNAVNFWGHGLGSYQTIFPLYATHLDSMLLDPVRAHFDLLQFWIEMGPGALLFAALIAISLLGQCEPARIILIGFMIEGLFGFPAYMPETSFIAALCMGHLYRHRLVLPRYFDTWRDFFLGDPKTIERERWIWASNAGFQNIPVGETLPQAAGATADFHR